MGLGNPGALLSEKSLQMSVLKVIFLFMVLGATSCSHNNQVAGGGILPHWLEKPPGLLWDAKSNAIAHLACEKRKTALSAKDRLHHQLYEPHHRIFLFQRPQNQQTPEQLNAILAAEAQALQATHMGIYENQDGRCLAMVLLRRQVDNKTSLPFFMNTKSGTRMTLQLRTPIQNPTLFIQHPDGRIDQQLLNVKENEVGFELRGAQWAKGHYIVEILGQASEGNPEILFWWRLTQKERTPHPWPRLKYEELSQTNLARGMKIENMIVQLRGTALVHRLRVSPQLKEVAHMRANVLSDIQGLGHKRPFSQTPDQTLNNTFEFPEVTRIVEIQSQSASLKEAWDGIVESPAHVAPLISQKVSHMAAAAVEGTDILGNPLITVVILLGNTPSIQQAPEALRMKMINTWNQERFNANHPLLKRNAQLEQAAQQAANAMRQEGQKQAWAVEKGLIGRVLDQNEALGKLTGSLVHTSAPEALDKLPWNDEKNWSEVGIGLVAAPDGTNFFVCILVGQLRE